MKGRSRFDLVRYDDMSIEKSARLKDAFKVVEATVERQIPFDCHAKERVMDSLEEAFRWCSRAVRDQQLDARGGDIM